MINKFIGITEIVKLYTKKSKFYGLGYVIKMSTENNV